MAIYYVKNTGATVGLEASNNWGVTKVSYMTRNGVLQKRKGKLILLRSQPMSNLYLTGGDLVLFKRGETYYGTLNLTKSGTSDKPINFGAYGEGENPIITGFTAVTEWVNKGGNLWESATAVSTLPYTRMVSIGGVNQPMGRFPKSGFLTYQSHVGNTSITSSSVSSGTNWVGAEIVIRKNRFGMETGKITKHVGGKLTYSDTGFDIPTNGFGFFIQNDIRTLTQQNDWFYNPTTKKLSVYSVGEPADVKVSSVERLVNGDWDIGSGDYNTFSNLSFIGSNKQSLYFSNKNNITVKNCKSSFSGIAGVETREGVNATIKNNLFENINGQAIRTSGSNLLVTNNEVNNTALITGITKDYPYGAISVSGDYSLVEGNKILNSGYNGIFFRGANTKVRKNYIRFSCLVIDDGGGIYTDQIMLGREITNNIILDTVGNSDGTSDSSTLAHGIYIDEKGNDILVTGNTVARSSCAGIFVHDTINTDIEDNILFDNGVSGNFTKAAIGAQQEADTAPVRNLSIKRNTIVSLKSYQLGLFFYSSQLSNTNLFSAGLNNKFINKGGAKYANTFEINNLNVFTLPEWQSLGRDTGSTVQNPTGVLELKYNATDVMVSIPLIGNYRDLDGNTLDTITLQPFSSMVLEKTA